MIEMIQYNQIQEIHLGHFRHRSTVHSRVNIAVMIGQQYEQSQQLLRYLSVLRFPF